MSEAIVDLTVSLYDFVLASEEVVSAGRSRVAERRHQLSRTAHALAERFQEARRDMGDDVAYLALFMKKNIQDRLQFLLC